MLTNSTNKIQFVGDGVTTLFVFPYSVFRTSDIFLFELDEDGINSVPVTAGYSVTLVVVDATSQTFNAQIIFEEPPPAGYQFTISRIVEYEQPLDLIQGGEFSAEDIEDALDNIVMQTQQLAEMASRAISLSEATTGDTQSLLDSVYGARDEALGHANDAEQSANEAAASNEAAQDAANRAAESEANTEDIFEKTDKLIDAGTLTSGAYNLRDSFTVDTAVPSGGTLTLPSYYFPTRKIMLVTYNGTICTPVDALSEDPTSEYQYEEVGTDPDIQSNTIIVGWDIEVGAIIDVWIIASNVGRNMDAIQALADKAAASATEAAGSATAAAESTEEAADYAESAQQSAMNAQNSADMARQNANSDYVIDQTDGLDLNLYYSQTAKWFLSGAGLLNLPPDFTSPVWLEIMTTVDGARALQAAHNEDDSLIYTRRATINNSDPENPVVSWGAWNSVAVPEVIKSVSVEVDPAGQPAGTYLVIVSETSSGDVSSYVNLSEVLGGGYTSGNGAINISTENAISLQIDPTDESGLVVSAAGLKGTPAAAGIDLSLATGVLAIANGGTGATNTADMVINSYTYDSTGTLGNRVITFKPSTGLIQTPADSFVENELASLPYSAADIDPASYAYVAGTFSTLNASSKYSGRVATKTIVKHGIANLSAPIPIVSGGTGATTAEGARANLGLGESTGPLAIANGGTGATNAAAARTALGIQGTGGMQLAWGSTITNAITTAPISLNHNLNLNPASSPYVVRIIAVAKAAASGVIIGDAFEMLGVYGNPATVMRVNWRIRNNIIVLFTGEGRFYITAENSGAYRAVTGTQTASAWTLYCQILM